MINLKKGKREVELEGVLQFLWRMKTVILLAAIGGALLCYLLVSLLVKPVYQSNFRLYVRSAQERGDGTIQTDTSTDSSLTLDYALIIKARSLAEAVIADLQLKGERGLIDANTLLENLSVDIGDGTVRILTVRVQNGNPYLAADIAGSLCDHTVDRIRSMTGMDTIKVIDQPNIPTKPVSSGKRLYIILGFLLGAVLAAAVCIAWYVSGDRILTAEDVTKYSGLEVLAEIPGSRGKRWKRWLQKALEFIKAPFDQTKKSRRKH